MKMILDDIIAHTHAEVADRRQRIPLAEMRARAESASTTRDFAGALKREHVALIAEVKRASPSRGTLRAEIDPGQWARTYAASGASAISVLTDDKYFRGSLADLAAVRAAVEIPVLRKDFIVDEYQVYESRAGQADAILLIVRVLTNTQLRDYLALAQSLGLGALTEVHDEADLDRTLAAGARIIGVNNRDLKDFTINLATTERLAPRIPHDRIVVAESGVFTRGDVERVARAGAHAVLVGEALMRAEDIGAKVSELACVKQVGSASTLIEHAVVDDAETILDLQRLAYQSEAELYQDWAIPPLIQTLEELTQEFETHAFLKAVLKGQLVGSVRAHLRQGTCFIERLIVHPDWQNRGIGTRLMTAIEDSFGAAQRYELFTGERSERNLHLYQKLGYKPFRSERLNEKVILVFLEKAREAVSLDVRNL
jgi:indole-3-glycerol phosphate synthase